MTTPPQHPALPLLAAAITPPTDDADNVTLLRTIAIGDVLARMVDERTKEVREQLKTSLGRGGQQKVAGLGTATVTDPEAQGRITDRDAFARWLAEHHPNLVLTREEFDPVAVAKAAEADETIREQIAALVPDAIVTATYMDDDALDAVIGRYARTDPDAPERLAVGPVADADGVPIPGVEVATKASPTLQVRLNKTGRERLIAALRSAIDTPTHDEEQDV